MFRRLGFSWITGSRGSGRRVFSDQSRVLEGSNKIYDKGAITGSRVL